MKARLEKRNLIVTPQSEKEEAKLKKWFLRDCSTEEFFQEFTLENFSPKQIKKEK